MPWTIPNLVLHDKPVSLANMRTHGRNMCLSFAAIRTVIATLNWTSAGLPDNLTFGDLQPRRRDVGPSWLLPLQFWFRRPSHNK